MASGKGFGLARKASEVRKTIVTGRPSLAIKAATLEPTVRRSRMQAEVVPTLAPTFHLRRRLQALVGENRGRAPCMKVCLRFLTRSALNVLRGPKNGLPWLPQEIMIRESADCYSPEGRRAEIGFSVQRVRIKLTPVQRTMRE